MMNNVNTNANINSEVPYTDNRHINYRKNIEEDYVRSEYVEDNIPARMQLIWTGGGYYTRYVWKGEVLYHRNSKKEGLLYREKPLNKDGVHVIDVERYEHKRELESLIKKQLLEDFEKAGILVTREMRDWACAGTSYKWQFFPSLKTDQIIALNRGDWHGCVWSSEHHTIVTVHPRLMEILSN